MSSCPVESEPQPIARSELRLSAPTCQHEQYERLIEDDRFARAQCLHCQRSWLEIDITVDREPSGKQGDRQRYPRLMPPRFDEDDLDPILERAELP